MSQWPIEEYKDIESLNFYHSVARETNNDPDELAYVMRSIQILGRDNARIPSKYLALEALPSAKLQHQSDGRKWANGWLTLSREVQWDSSPFSGFTDRAEGGWMRTHDLYREINAEKQAQEADSVLSFWKSMIKLRKEHGDVFTHGTFEVFEPDNEQTFVFAKRGQNGRDSVVVLNFTQEEQEVNLPQDGLVLTIGNYLDAEAVEATVPEGSRVRSLRPWEGRLYLTT